MSRVGEMLFRHQTHTKAPVVLKCRAVAVVAPRQCARVDMLNVQGLRYVRRGQ